MQNLKQKHLNKKGLSNLIASVLIILLSITAIATLSTQIFSLVNSPTLSPETSCPILLSKQPIQVIKTCYNTETSETEITLTRNNQNIKISQLSFLLDEESFSCGESCGTCQILQTGTEKYYFDKDANQLTLFVNNCFAIQKTIENC
jgi:hypothetical protein|tara:strand:- start:387 stop:827 length:441 start_codon:yes stop_codon:yes gene_type:complete